MRVTTPQTTGNRKSFAACSPRANVGRGGLSSLLLYPRAQGRALPFAILFWDTGIFISLVLSLELQLLLLVRISLGCPLVCSL